MRNVKAVLAVFSEEIRLRMMMLLWDSVLCVNCLILIFDLPQSTVSRHLSLLRRNRIVKVVRQRTYCYYTLETAEPLGLLKHRLVKTYYEALKDTEPFRIDRERLEKLKNECTADCKVHIKNKGGRK